MDGRELWKRYVELQVNTGRPRGAWDSWDRVSPVGRSIWDQLALDASADPDSTDRLACEARLVTGDLGMLDG